MGVTGNYTANVVNRFDWSGNLIVSVYSLQTSYTSPYEIVPNLAIEFDPNSQPIVQFSLTQDLFKDIGYVLTDVLQPVDFVFSSSILGSTINPVVVPGNYYMISKYFLNSQSVTALRCWRHSHSRDWTKCSTKFSPNDQKSKMQICTFAETSLSHFKKRV